MGVQAASFFASPDLGARLSIFSFLFYCLCPPVVREDPFVFFFVPPLRDLFLVVCYPFISFFGRVRASRRPPPSVFVRVEVAGLFRELLKAFRTRWASAQRHFFFFFLLPVVAWAQPSFPLQTLLFFLWFVGGFLVASLCWGIASVRVFFPACGRTSFFYFAFVNSLCVFDAL